MNWYKTASQLYKYQQAYPKDIGSIDPVGHNISYLDIGHKPQCIIWWIDNNFGLYKTNTLQYTTHLDIENAIARGRFENNTISVIEETPMTDLEKHSPLKYKMYKSKLNNILNKAFPNAKMLVWK